MTREELDREIALIPERIDAGVYFLDAQMKDENGKPNWRTRIDPDDFLMESPCRCILGQTDSNFYSHARELGLNMRAAGEMGFYHPAVIPSNSPELDAYYNALDAAWREELGFSKDAPETEPDDEMDPDTDSDE
jgi:hypothetical protein